MSRLDELKKQYPQLNITMFDLLTRIDTSKSYKYLPVLCKIFSKRFDPKSQYHKDDYLKGILEIQSRLIGWNISTDNLKEQEMYFILHLADLFPSEYYDTFKEFIRYMDSNKITNNDVTSYTNLDEIRNAVSLASIKEMEDEYASQVIKEFEDEKWVAVRPLTFGASAKYGASTRWCTTYQREKNYFERYWRQGVLVYFINKKTGYKFALYKNVSDNDISFWNAEDSKVDFLTLNIDDYLFPIIREIVKSKDTNKNLSSNEIQEQVHKECIDEYAKIREMIEPDVVNEVQEAVPEIGRLYAVEENYPTEAPQYVEDIPRMNDRLVEAARIYNEIVDERG